MIGNNLRPNRPADNSGFTLAEMLVTVGVFAITMAIASSVFINVNNLQQQASNMAKLQNEGRYILEKIGKEVRGRELDYAATAPGPDGAAQALVFKKDEFGDVYNIYYDQAGQAIRIETASADAAVKDAALSANEVIVDKLEFIVSPLADPYDVSAGNPPMQQPRVTVMLVLKNRNVMDKYKKTLQLQTTISSKVYR